MGRAAVTRPLVKALARRERQQGEEDQVRWAPEEEPRRKSSMAERESMTVW